MQRTDYTIKEVIAKLNCSRQTVYDLIADGTLQSYTVKSRRRITSESVDALRGVTAA